MTEMQRIAASMTAVVVLTLAGGLLPLLREWDPRTIRRILAFGTGVLLGAAFFHMIPEAATGLGRGVGAPILAGFLAIYVLERFVMVHPCEEQECNFHQMGMAAFVGITVHALIDGFALGAALSVPQLSLAVTLAIVLHKLPASLSLTGILLHCEYSRRRIGTMVVLFAIATPIGALISHGFLSDLRGDALAFAIAFSAGTCLAIATSDLLPQVHAVPHGRFGNLLALFAGILAMSFSMFGGGDHGHDHVHGQTTVDQPSTSSDGADSRH
jgi:zinc and cadmium transporter